MVDVLKKGQVHTCNRRPCIKALIRINDAERSVTVADENIVSTPMRNGCEVTAEEPFLVSLKRKLTKVVILLKHQIVDRRVA